MSVAGAVLAILGFGYAVFLVAYKILHGQPIQGWSSLMVAIAFFSGVQLLSLGILGEYLWRTLDAARARKGFLVHERTDAPSRDAPAPSP
jgi:dolichol-phosphate mannosyltransferase